MFLFLKFIPLTQPLNMYILCMSHPCGRENCSTNICDGLTLRWVRDSYLLLFTSLCKATPLSMGSLWLVSMQWNATKVKEYIWSYCCAYIRTVSILIVHLPFFWPWRWKLPWVLQLHKTECCQLQEKEQCCLLGLQVRTQPGWYPECTRWDLEQRIQLSCCQTPDPQTQI